MNPTEPSQREYFEKNIALEAEITRLRKYEKAMEWLFPENSSEPVGSRLDRALQHYLGSDSFPGLGALAEGICQLADEEG